MGSPPLEIWIGLESTINRVQDRYVSQSLKSNHINRISDLERFAELGAKRIRYPALWESVVSENENDFDWNWLDQRMAELQRLQLEPVIGLIHHGSGPRFTSLIDPEFPIKFANYAKHFANRYPWVTDYTPINEILTTAFFSCLYGHWYPHKKNDRDTVFAVCNQVKAVILAMQEIRKVNPQAKLIQTEDIGRAQSTAPLSYQAEFQNHRRWLSFDLLFGRINQHHSLANYLQDAGMTLEQMDWFIQNACPPDILGVNHYLLSDRFLDHRIERFPSELHGGNGIHQYADVGAIDTDDIQAPTPGSILKEVWERYHTAIAVTEAHLCGPRESQLRWLNQVWNEAIAVKQSGADIRAVTVWSLLGTYDWNKLCTVDAGFYESGVFDIRTPNGDPRPTAIAKMIQQLARGQEFQHPTLQQVGWWRNYSELKVRPLVITGKGTLANAFARICQARRIGFVQLDRTAMDITNPKSAQEVLSKLKPWAIINAAGYVKVDQAEKESEICFHENVDGPSILANWCKENSVSFVTFSSDLVFNGEQPNPYAETDVVDPINIYGKSKAAAEKKVQEVFRESLIIRSSSFFGPWDEHNFLIQVLRRLSGRQPVVVPENINVSPTFVPDLVNGTLDLLMDGETGLVHLTNKGSLSWANFAALGASMAKSKNMDLDCSLIFRSQTEWNNDGAKRPKNSALISKKFEILPPLENAIERFFLDLEVQVKH